MADVNLCEIRDNIGTFNVSSPVRVICLISMRTQDFHFDLPPHLIAQFPGAQRDASRLLHVNPSRNSLTDDHFTHLPNHLRAGDVLVFNDTQVIKARLFGQKASGGQVELLIERLLDEHEALCFIRASHAPKPGSFLRIANVDIQVLGREHDLYHVRFETQSSVLSVLEQHGQLPLPPYIEHSPEAEDEARYQTVYAQHPGAVAAPTAGLHFNEAMLDTLDQLGVIRVHLTLHVGAGTFQPVRVDNLADHIMHSERYLISDTAADTINLARDENRRIMAVGTTSLRALESAARNGRLQAGSGDTRLFITPGYRFQLVDRLLTNFHLPKSTLLMLVSAFSGTDAIRQAYAHAIAQNYRFFSYGDAMLLERALTV
jgi:S-adenosylmethionine:tRNA ribosyltransferase-isomerase